MSIKGKKTITRVLVTILVFIIIVVLIINLFGDRALKVGIETAGSKALKVPVELDSVSLSILGGNVALKKLQVGNPEGYTNPNLLTLDSGKVQVSVDKLMGNPVKIDQITLNGATVVIEQKGLSNNLQEILKGIEKKEQDTTDQTEGKPLEITELELNNVQVQVKLLPMPGRDKDISLTLKPIQMNDLGSKDKLDLAELATRILLAIAGGIVEQGGDLLPQEIIGPMSTTLAEAGKILKDIGGQAGEAGKELMEKGKEIGTDAMEKGKEAVEGVGNALEGLLNKKED
ncbi:MAG: AsmA family protein [Sedimentisphaerales bacterium]|nr:AsmA family protein [Sedimentisphaerales bacterium]